MNILVGEGKLFSNSDFGSVFSSGSFHSSNRPSSVNKVNGVSPVNSYDESAISRAEKSFVANTPAATISISGLGKAALLSLDSLKIGNKSTVNESSVSDDNIYSTAQADKNSNELTVISSSDDENSEGTDAQASETGVPNLGLYSEIQLKDMVNSGTITRSEMNDELAKREHELKLNSGQGTEGSWSVDPVMKQAIDAYNFQMAYQIHAAVTN